MTQAGLQVAHGRNNRLFLAKTEGYELAGFLDGAMWRAVPLALWRATLRRRARELARRGVAYIVLIAPDAPSVHTEDLPAPPPDALPLGARFIAAMGAVEGVSFVYPRDPLREARGGLEVYPRTESHWSSYGGLVATRVLLAELRRCRPDIAWGVPQPVFKMRRAYGDLGSATELEMTSDVPVPVYAGPEPTRVLDRGGAERQTAVETAWPDAGGRVLAFRDSFMTEMAPHLARTAGAFRRYGSTSRLLLDAVEDWQPDVVISEIAERRLVDHQSDHILERHDSLYLADYRSEEGQIVLRVLNRARAAPAQAAEQVRAHPQLWTATPVTAFCGARLLEAAGDVPGAAALADRACAARPQDPAFRALRGRIALAEGLLDRAVADASAAAEAAPWNGYYAELLVYALIQAHRPDQARARAPHALERIDDHPQLWYWASVLHREAGDVAASRAALARARELAPSEPAYLAA